MAVAMIEAGIPKEAVSVYHGHAVGQTVVQNCGRAMVFGGQQTIDLYKANPGVQVHGPGYSKIILGDDAVDDWPAYLDMMVDSVFLNSGRSCINASSIWVSRHGREIAQAIAERLADVRPLDPQDPDASLAAFTVAGVAEAVSGMIDGELAQGGATDVSAELRDCERAPLRASIASYCSHRGCTGIRQRPLANRSSCSPS